MKKKIIVSAVSVGLALAVIGASVGVYMSYINHKVIFDYLFKSSYMPV